MIIRILFEMLHRPSMRYSRVGAVGRGAATRGANVAGGCIADFVVCIIYLYIYILRGGNESIPLRKRE